MGLRLSKFLSNWGLKQKPARRLTRKLGINGKSKWIRQLKRSLGSARSSVFESPTSSASTVGYQHQGRTLSQLTGGV